MSVSISPPHSARALRLVDVARSSHSSVGESSSAAPAASTTLNTTCQQSGLLNPEEVVGRALQRLSLMVRSVLDQARNKDPRNALWELRSARLEQMNCSELLDLLCRKKIWHFVMVTMNLALSADVFDELRSVRHIWGSEVFYRPNAKSYAQHSLLLVVVALKMLGEQPIAMFEMIREYEWFFHDWDVWQHCKRQYERWVNQLNDSLCSDLCNDETTDGDQGNGLGKEEEEEEEKPVCFSVGMLDRAVVTELGIGMLHEVDAALVINSSGPEEPIEDIKPQISIMEGFPIERIFYPKYCISINVPMNTPPHIVRMCYDIGLQAAARNNLRAIILIPSSTIPMEETVKSLKRLSTSCPGVQSVVLIPKERELHMCKQLLDEHFAPPPVCHEKPRTLADIRIDAQRVQTVSIPVPSSPCPQFPTLQSVYGNTKKKRKSKCILYQIRDALIQLRDEIFGGIHFIDNMDVKHPVNMEVECQRLHDAYAEWARSFEPREPPAPQEEKAEEVDDFDEEIQEEHVVAEPASSLSSSGTQTHKAIIQVTDADIVYELVLAAEADVADGRRRSLLDVCVELQERWNVDARALKVAMQRRLADAVNLFIEICTGTTPEQAKRLLLAHSSHFIKEILLEAVDICEWASTEAQRLTTELGPIHDVAFQSILRDNLASQYGKQIKECPTAGCVWNQLATVIAESLRWEHISESSEKVGGVETHDSAISSPLLSPVMDESHIVEMSALQTPPPLSPSESPPLRAQRTPEIPELEHLQPEQSAPESQPEPKRSQLAPVHPLSEKSVHEQLQQQLASEQLQQTTETTEEEDTGDDQPVEIHTPRSQSLSIESVDTAFSSPLLSPSVQSVEDWELVDDDKD